MFPYLSYKDKWKKKKMSHNFLSMIENVQPIYLITPIIKDGDLSSWLTVFQIKYKNWIKAGPFFVVRAKFTKISFNFKFTSIEHFSVERKIIEELTPNPVSKAIELIYSLCPMRKLDITSKQLENLCMYDWFSLILSSSTE